MVSDRYLFNLLLILLCDGDSTTILGNLFQYLTHLIAYPSSPPLCNLNLLFMPIISYYISCGHRELVKAFFFAVTLYIYVNGVSFCSWKNMDLG